MGRVSLRSVESIWTTKIGSRSHSRRCLRASSGFKEVSSKPRSGDDCYLLGKSSEGTAKEKGYTAPAASPTENKETKVRGGRACGKIAGGEERGWQSEATA